METKKEVCERKYHKLDLLHALDTYFEMVPEYVTCEKLTELLVKYMDEK